LHFAILEQADARHCAEHFGQIQCDRNVKQLELHGSLATFCPTFNVGSI